MGLKWAKSLKLEILPDEVFEMEAAERDCRIVVSVAHSNHSLILPPSKQFCQSRFAYRFYMCAIVFELGLEQGI